jgi:hypothetical protein
MHEHVIEDSRGDAADAIPLCSDSCHQDYDRDHDLKYEGWNGAHESPDYNTFCAQCGVIAGTGPEACEHQRDNVVVNRFPSKSGEMCRHGNWIQLPRRMLT